MNTVRRICQSDDSGTVHVDVPVGAPHRNVEVVVTWDEEDTSATPSEANGWPQGWFGATFGSIDDPTFVRHSQGNYEVREDLE